MTQACNILVPTARSEARQISEPGLQHSWISEHCGDLIAWPPTALCQIPYSKPDTPESNIRLHHEILRQEWVIGYSALVRRALHTQKHRSFTQTGLTLWINCVTVRNFVISRCHVLQVIMPRYTVHGHGLRPKSCLGDVWSTQICLARGQTCLLTPLINHTCIVFLWLTCTVTKVFSSFCIQLLCSVDFNNRFTLKKIPKLETQSLINNSVSPNKSIHVAFISVLTYESST